MGAPKVYTFLNPSLPCPLPMVPCDPNHLLTKLYTKTVRRTSVHYILFGKKLTIVITRRPQWIFFTMFTSFYFCSTIKYIVMYKCIYVRCWGKINDWKMSSLAGKWSFWCQNDSVICRKRCTKCVLFSNLYFWTTIDVNSQDQWAKMSDNKLYKLYSYL